MGILSNQTLRAVSHLQWHRGSQIPRWIPQHLVTMPQWLCPCGYRNHQKVEWCGGCQSHYGHVAWQPYRRSRSKSGNGKGKEAKKHTDGKGIPPFDQLEISDPPWNKTTPHRKLATPHQEAGTPQPATVAPTPPGESMPYDGMGEIQAMAEQYKDKLPPDLTAALERMVKSSTSSSSMGPSLTHAHLSKANQARSAFQKSRARVMQLDAQWKAFTDLLKANYKKQQDRYSQQRQEAVEIAKAKKTKWEEVQQEIQEITQRTSNTGQEGHLQMEPEMAAEATMPWDTHIEVPDNDLMDVPDMDLKAPTGNAMEPFRGRRAGSPPDKMRKTDT